MVNACLEDHESKGDEDDCRWNRQPGCKLISEGLHVFEVSAIMTSDEVSRASTARQLATASSFNVSTLHQDLARDMVFKIRKVRTDEAEAVHSLF